MTRLALMRRHPAPATDAVRPDDRLQPLKDVGPITVPGQRLHVASHRVVCTTGVSRPPPSSAEKALSARLAERLQRLLPARLRLRQQRLKRGLAAQRVEGAASGKRRRHEVALGHGALQVAEALFVLADVTEQPSLLEDRLRVVLNLSTR